MGSFTDTNISSDSQAISLMIFSPRNGHRHGFKSHSIGWLVGKFHNEDGPSSQPNTCHNNHIYWTTDMAIRKKKILAAHSVTWWRHQMETFSRYWPFVPGIHRSPVNPTHKGQWCGALMFSLIWAWSKKTSKLSVTGLCEGNSPVTGEFPAQRASKAENVSIWWRYYAIYCITDMTILYIIKYRQLMVWCKSLLDWWWVRNLSIKACTVSTLIKTEPTRIG